MREFYQIFQVPMDKYFTVYILLSSGNFWKRRKEFGTAPPFILRSSDMCKQQSSVNKQRNIIIKREEIIKTILEKFELHLMTYFWPPFRKGLLHWYKYIDMEQKPCVTMILLVQNLTHSLLETLPKNVFWS